MSKKKHEEHENHERWLVSYADFITLLFALFVVMYSTSSVNEGKYRAVSESAQAAFNPSTLTAKKIEIGPKLSSGNRSTGKVEYIAAIKDVLKEFEQNKKLSIFQNSKGIVIRITDTALFDSGSAESRMRLSRLLTAWQVSLQILKKIYRSRAILTTFPLTAPFILQTGNFHHQGQQV